MSQDAMILDFLQGEKIEPYLSDNLRAGAERAPKVHARARRTH
jgi:hypothetical protein